jgi:hypothetical protein
MKHVFALVITLLAAALFGCKDSAAPKSEVRVESASEAARNDERAIAKRLAEQKGATDEAFQRQRANESRQRNVDALRAIATRWNDSLSQASLTPRSDIAEPLKKLQTIKSDADTVEVDDCTGSARATLQSAMSASIEAFSLFQKETGPSADSTTQKIQQGADLLRAAQREISACLPK